jgi:hypothetical protein
MYRLGYSVLRIFHWILFFIIVEIAFYCAGWMLFGAIGVVLDGAVGTAPELNPDGPTGHIMQTIGKGVGLVAGVLFMRFVLGRYRKR